MNRDTGGTLKSSEKRNGAQMKTNHNYFVVQITNGELLVLVK